MTPGPGTVALQVLLLVAGDIPLVMGRAEGSWGSSSVGALRPDPSYPPGTCRASGGHWAWPKPVQVLVGPGALLGDRLWGRQALPQLFTAWGRPVHDCLVAHVELGLSRDQGLLVLLNDWGDPGKDV